jgi:hypothetical protein
MAHWPWRLPRSWLDVGRLDGQLSFWWAIATRSTLPAVLNEGAGGRAAGDAKEGTCVATHFSSQECACTVLERAGVRTPIGPESPPRFRPVGRGPRRPTRTRRVRRVRVRVRPRHHPAPGRPRHGHGGIMVAGCRPLSPAARPGGPAIPSIRVGPPSPRGA